MPIRVLSRVSIFASCCRRTSPRAELSVELPRFTFGGEGAPPARVPALPRRLPPTEVEVEVESSGSGGTVDPSSTLSAADGRGERGAESMETSTPRRSRSAGVSAGWGELLRKGESVFLPFSRAVSAFLRSGMPGPSLNGSSRIERGA